MSGRALQYLGSVFFVFQAQCIVLFDYLIGKGTDKKLIFTYIIITTVYSLQGVNSIVGRPWGAVIPKSFKTAPKIQPKSRKNCEKK